MKLQARIPADSPWTIEDLETKAAELGMNKSEFIVDAVDFFMNFDSATYLKLKIFATGAHLPTWLYMQNNIIKEMAQTAAELEVGKIKSKLVDDYILLETKEGPQILTGLELFEELKKLYILAYKNKIE